MEHTKDYIHQWHGYARADRSETAKKDEKEVELGAICEDSLIVTLAI